LFVKIKKYAASKTEAAFLLKGKMSNKYEQKEKQRTKNVLMFSPFVDNLLIKMVLSSKYPVYAGLLYSG